MVNVLVEHQIVVIELKGMAESAGIAYIIGGYGREQRNVLGEPEAVVPWTDPVLFDAGTFRWTVPPESVCILRLHKTNPS